MPFSCLLKYVTCLSTALAAALTVGSAVAADWLPETDLTYGFVSTATSLGDTPTRDAFRAAFDMWEEVTPLTFSEVPDCGLPPGDPACSDPDIRITFSLGECPIGCAFPPCGGAPTTLAGDLVLNDSLTWRVDPGYGLDLRTVAAHEIGHAVGLLHPDGKCPGKKIGELALMCANYGSAQHYLSEHDVDAIQAIYGGVAPAACIEDTLDPGASSFENLRCLIRLLRVKAADPVEVSEKAAKSLPKKLKKARFLFERTHSECLMTGLPHRKALAPDIVKRVEKFSDRVDKEELRGRVSSAFGQELRDRADAIIDLVLQREAGPDFCAP